MLESNNHQDGNMNKEKKIKKKKSSLFIFVMIYILLAMLVTISSIIFHNKTGMSIIAYFTKTQQVNESESIQMKNQISDSNIEKNEEYSVENSKLTDKYFLNNIELEEVKKEIRQNYVYEREEDRGYVNTITYYQISGLKDKTVEEKINKDIQQKVGALLTLEEVENEQIENITINSYVWSNFANVLSIDVYKTIDYKNEEYSYSSIYLNYRLDTAEELEFKDLFTSNASIKNILSRTLYNDLAFQYGLEYMWSDENNAFDDPDMDNVDYSKIENEVFRFIDNYNKEKEITFYFTPTDICIIIGDAQSKISMLENHEYIAVYNLVNPEKSLYDKGNLEKVNYVFGAPYISDCVVFEKISDNIFLSIFNYHSEDTDECKEFLKAVEENLNEIISVIKENENMEYNQNGKGKIYNLNYMYIEGEEISVSGEKIEVDLKNFDKQIDEVFANNSRIGTDVEYYLNIIHYGEKTDNQFNIRIENINGKKILFQGKFGEEILIGTNGTKVDYSGNVIEEIELEQSENLINIPIQDEIMNENLIKENIYNDSLIQNIIE